MKTIGILLNKRADLGAPMSGIEIDYIFDHYSKCIVKAGAMPVLIPLTKNKEVMDNYFNIIDGLIIPGGIDVDPKNYGEMNSRFIEKLNPALDKFGMYMINKAIETKTPLLGICRGHQLVNVALGGSLFQDNSMFNQNNHGVWSTPDHESHNILIEDDSKMFEIYGANFLAVNSFHHQSVKEVGQGLKISAKSEDGFIEALEGENILTVQYHPEMLCDVSEESKSLELFKYFVEKM